MNEQIPGQGELFKDKEEVTTPEVTKTEPIKEERAQSAEEIRRAAILKLKMEISDTESQLEIMEKQADDGVLPSGAYFRLESLRAKLSGLKNSLAELDKPASIYEVLFDEFIERFEHYKGYLEEPSSAEALRFMGIMRVLRKNTELHQQALKNPSYKEYTDNN